MKKKFFDIVENKNKPKTKEDKMEMILESMNKNL